MKLKEKVLLLFYRVYFNSLAFLLPDIASKQLIAIFSHPRKRVVRKKEIETLSSAIKSKLEVDGCDLVIYKWGEGKKKALLIHGWESNAGSLGAFVKPLLEYDYEVLAFDAPAHGASSGRKSNLLYFKEATKKVIDLYGTPDLLIGHSLGANAIIQTAYELDIPFHQVVLIAPLNRLMSVFEMYRDILKLPKLIFTKFLMRFGNESGYKFENFYFHELANKSQIIRALIFHSIDDKITLFQHAEELNERWDRSELAPIKDVGHYGILWKKEVIAKTIEFLRNT